MGKRKNTKTNDVLEHLRRHGSITSMEAFGLYGATRLSAIIFELRRKGFNISNEWLETTDRYGSTVRFVRYRLKREE